ncbi:MAG: hypothetical protein IJ160_01010 [Muribaculaceae bacterium]|nr:hypothetical protein [Muribaculaceae bacterium]
MTTTQLNAEILRNMSRIIEDEGLMKQLAKYLRRLVVKLPDPTLLSEEEFYAKLDEAEREIVEGKGVKMLPGESLDDLLKRVS